MMQQKNMPFCGILFAQFFFSSVGFLKYLNLEIHLFCQEDHSSTVWACQAGKQEDLSLNVGGAEITFLKMTAKKKK